ncbi:MAG: hypothetical protein FWE71_11080 [Nocardioidaceae bacterium]|nr:hypothetical protein [Nocardioidaceae bacterium]MCL2613872.1 hypothetical protein [Nocardioidaceae bacterium]
MLHRRPTAIAAPVLGLVLAASMSACGFHYPTDRVNTISAGVNNRTTTVDALGIRILASAPGQGRLIGALSNERTTSATLTKVSDPNDGIQVEPFKPIPISARGKYNLATMVQDPIFISGKFGPGQVVMGLQLTVERGGQPETMSLNVPVVKPCHFYTSVPTPTQQPTTRPSQRSQAGATASAKGSAHHASGAPTTSPSPTSTDSYIPGDANKGGTRAFACSNPTPTTSPAG